VYLEIRRDPALLGGIVTRIGSEVYDGSLRTRLARLREALARA
jgi:F0F1-type ATP synthase delta subunit